MGFASGLHKKMGNAMKNTLPGGKWSPGGQVHRGINKAVGIDEEFALPGRQGIIEHVQANRRGDSQWQKFNPTNLRDYNEKQGYNYKEGGRDPKPQATTQPVGGTTGAGRAPIRPPQAMTRPMQAPAGMRNPMQGARQPFTGGGNPMARQMAQVQGLRRGGPPNPTGRRF